jgi:hypothetical protein
VKNVRDANKRKIKKRNKKEEDKEEVVLENKESNKSDES